MKWSLATVALLPRGTTAHVGPEQWKRTLDWAADAGFAGIEISPHWLDINNAQPSQLASFGSDAGRAGIAVSGINVNRCFSTHGLRSDEMQRAIDAAAMLKARLVTFSLSLPLASGRAMVRGDDFSEQERGRAAAILRDLADRAAAEGIQLSLELHDDGLLDTPDLCLDMLRRIGAANVGVNPDLGNLVRSQPAPVDWEGALRALAPQTNNWHVKNYRGGEPAPLWAGEIDYGLALEVMQAAGYQGWVSIESYFDNPLALQRQSLDWLKQVAKNESTNQKQESGA